ncbi:hypothetical protein GE09DRAFT_975517 [Coniochaeta sp. 2T2.1]|nr:hypothetical protein GE09DRAFT_975517 [Coniochaeta sp. 2T2.1]
MPGPVATAHSHRPTTKVSHKAFKSKHATKSSLRDAAKGKVPSDKGTRKTPYQQVMSKFDRRNQNKQRQVTKHKEHQNQNLIFTGKDAAPRNVVVIPLCADGDARAAIKHLNESVDVEADVTGTTNRVSIDRFKQKMQYIPMERDLQACMDAARVADFVVLVLSAETEVDAVGELILRSIESQGLSTLFTVIQGLNKVEPAKLRLGTVASLKSYITHFHPEQEKLYSLDNRQEMSNLMRSLCSTTPKGIRWRDERSWMMVEDVKFGADGSQSTVLTGVVRGKGLKADRLVQVGDWGTFQIEKITSAPLPAHRKKRADDMAVDETPAEETLEVPGEDADDLEELAPEVAVMEHDDDEDMDADVATTMTGATRKGVLLDDHHYFSDDDAQNPSQPRKLPKGTSSYQAAWYLDDNISDSGSDLEDYEMQDVEEGHAQPADGEEGWAGAEMTEGAPSEYPRSEKFEQPDELEDARDLEAFRALKHDEARDDLEFPDEIELHPNVLARERLLRYRGLKSLRTSPWNQEEDRDHEPEDWRRLLQVPHYQGSRVKAAREALVGGVAPGTRVHVYLKDVPSSIQESYDATKPVTLFSLLRHENKRTVCNVLINLSSDYDHSIKAKEDIIMQLGPRRFVINPLFSTSGNTPNDVHKYCRYLHPGQSAVGTFVGPVTWGSVPALFYKRTIPDEDSEEESSVPLTLIGTGTSLPPSTNRIIAKRIILTGHPYHIHKKIVTIRYMFFNREDVDWFKALPLWTKRGRTGYIKEALGTHGYFKATFDGRINPQDSIGVSLYKRVWPRDATRLSGLLDFPEEDESVQEVEMDDDVE